MNTIRMMLRYVGYYIVAAVLISILTPPPIATLLMKLCGAAIFISMFASIIQMLTGGSIGDMAQKISTWCLRITVIAVGIGVIGAFGIEKIVNAFM